MYSPPKIVVSTGSLLEVVLEDASRTLGWFVFIVASTSGRNGALCRQYWMPRQRNLRFALGLGGQVPELNTEVFIIPSRYVKNGRDRLVVLNQIAASVVDDRRGNHHEHVFSFRGVGNAHAEFGVVKGSTQSRHPASSSS